MVVQIEPMLVKSLLRSLLVFIEPLSSGHPAISRGLDTGLNVPGAP